MSESRLHNKTIRPGSLNGYSYYYSSRQPARATTPKASKKSTSKKKSGHKLYAVVILAVLLAVPFLSYQNAANGSSDTDTTNSAIAKPDDTDKKATPAAASSKNHCAGNIENKLIKIDLSERHLWACEQSKVAYNAPVITGMTAHASTVTPTGTYHVYGKTTNTALTGSDEAGSWNYPVSYWMPFLDNQHGTYGFHDATWRNNNEFGKIDQNSSDASHGCVELPLAAMTWLYNWAPMRTTLTIEN